MLFFEDDERFFDSPFEHFLKRLANKRFLLGYRNGQQIIPYRRTGLIEPLSGGTEKGQFLNNFTWRLPKAYLITEAMRILRNALGIDFIRFTSLHSARLLDL